MQGSLEPVVSGAVRVSCREKRSEVVLMHLGEPWGMGGLLGGVCALTGV